VILVGHILLAVAEFFILNWLGRRSRGFGYYQISFLQSVEDAPLFNAVFRVLAPAIFLVLVASAFYALGLDRAVEGIWRVTVFYFAIRWAFNFVMGRARLLRWSNQIIVAALAIGLSLLTYWQFLIDRSVVLPSARGLTDQLWIVVILFLYSTYNRLSLSGNELAADRRRHTWVGGTYLRLKREYGQIIHEESPSDAVEATAYAIMIYESFNRPPLYQAIERWVLYPLRLAKTLGPMQVSTNQRQSDAELVRVGVQKVARDFALALDEVRASDPVGSTTQTRRDEEAGIEVPHDPANQSEPPLFSQLPGYKQDNVVRRTAAKYNIRSDYPLEVAALFSLIASLYYEGVVDPTYI
jgi:hypothetical protein